PWSATTNDPAAQPRVASARFRRVRLMVRTCCLLGSCQVELPKQLDRWTFEAFQRQVADVAEVLAADRTRIEPGGGKITVHRKKARRIAPFRGSARCRADVIADAGLLSGIECDKSLSEASRGFGIEPVETGEHDRTIALTIRIGRTHPLIDKIDDADAGRAARVLIGGDDEIGQRCRELSLRR